MFFIIYTYNYIPPPYMKYIRPYKLLIPLPL
nr:MAG TPA: Per os infectivity factor [Caudoviricetes sp.]